jgi:ribosomal protein S27AE
MNSDTKVRAPSHVCPRCGERWIVEPLEQDKWMIIRYGDTAHRLSQVAFTPECPACEGVVLEPWLIAKYWHIQSVSFLM